MMTLNTLSIEPLDQEAGAKTREYVNTLTKPVGSLGRLEELAIELSMMTGDPFPKVTPPGVLIFAADHGIVEEGVSAYPQAVTAQMVLNFLAGGAAISVFSRQIGALLEIIDMGVATDLKANGLVNRKMKFGTANFLKQDAMTREEAIHCLDAGMKSAEEIINKGAKLVIIGEMGIGNTTSSSAILAALTDLDLDSLVGKGTGISNEALNLKKQVILEALIARKVNAKDPLDVLAKVGGFEIGAMAGAILGAAAKRIPVLADGLISTVAALLAFKIHPTAADYLIVGHQSVEPGHIHAIQELEKRPLLNLDLRLGEGSGAAVAFPIVEAAVRMLSEMATFSSANVSEKL